MGLLLCGPLIRLYGWPCVFHLFAALGFVWCLIWPILKPSLRDAAVWRSKSTRQKLKYYDDTRTRRKAISLSKFIFICLSGSLEFDSQIATRVGYHFCTFLL